MSADHKSLHGAIRSFGRVKGRSLKPRQAGLIDALLPHLAVDLEAPLGTHAEEASPRVGAELVPPAAPSPDAYARVVVEIGFGGGEHLVAQAGAAPETLFLGAEPFLNGVGSCLRHIEESGVANVRLHHGDARDVLAALPDASLDCVYILFSDPWPKKRHWKRRLIQAEFVGELARVLKPGGEARFATDWAHYAAWTLGVFLREPFFTWRAECAGDWRMAWEGHVPTRYEQKRLGDCAPIWLRVSRA